LSDLLVNLLVQHPNDASTLVANLSGIVEAHSWELCYAWMASMDDNYKRGAEISLNEGNYRIVRVNCDVDVSVRDENGGVVAQIVNENPQEIRGSSIISAVNENGEKVVILPLDSAYRVSVTRRDDETASLLDAENPETVNIGIDEYSAQTAEVTRGVDYLDVPLSAGETLESVIPAVEDGDADYTLTAPDGNAIPSTSDLSGAAAEASYTVTASPDSEKSGMVLGGGAFRYGDFAQVEATPHDGYAFAGWYADAETPVSTEAVYRFCVTQDAALVARFTAQPPKAVPAAVSFTDVSPQSYCYDAVLWAVGNGIVSGTTDTTFSPKEPCTAAQAVTFLWRAAGSPEPSSTESPFTDLDPGAYYYKAVLWAAEHDITMGTTESTFSPDKTVSRSQFITLLYRTFGNAERVESCPFEDVAADAYYRDAVAWAYARGVTRGTTATTFAPLRSCDRGQIVTFLYRYFAG
ncbi:MAG: S-layer homology domain-containing protein, partial [Oscillibacter sp.]|nr:S-layer homology domain-containing protein [Oscillibacter sp.]